MSVQRNTFASSFGSTATMAPKSLKQQLAASTAAVNDEFVKAEFWLNIGYVTVVPVMDKELGEMVEQERFVGLPKGIALDTMTELDSGNGDGFFAQMQAARMDLAKDILELAQTLQPGESRVLDGDIGGLQLQLRRVQGERAPIDPASNPLRKKLGIFG